MSATSASLTVGEASVVGEAVTARVVVTGTVPTDVTAGWAATGVVAAGTVAVDVGPLLAPDDPHAASPTVMLTAIAASITAVGPSR